MLMYLSLLILAEVYLALPSFCFWTQTCISLQIVGGWSICICILLQKFPFVLLGCTTSSLGIFFCCPKAAVSKRVNKPFHPDFRSLPIVHYITKAVDHYTRNHPVLSMFFWLTYNTLYLVQNKSVQTIFSKSHLLLHFCVNVEEATRQFCLRLAPMSLC